MTASSSLLSSTGFLLLFHAAYSCLHFRSLLQDMDLQDSVQIPPNDVYAELGMSFTMILVGQLMGAGTLQSVEVLDADHRKPLAAPAFRTRKFDIYQHRPGKFNIKDKSK